MHAALRKTAIDQYKDRSPKPGIFVIKGPAPLVWVSPSPDAPRAQNRHWFSLRQASHPNAGLQAMWNLHGEAAFRFEIIETLPDDLTPYERDQTLKSRLSHWIVETGGARL